MTNANECTCPSGDGSLAHPCPAHPAVEQAGGDERKLSDLGPEGAPVIGCLCGMPMTEGHHSPDGCCNLEEFAPQAQAEQAEAERPEVVGYRVSMPDEPELGHWLEEEAESEPQIQHHEPLMSVAQHDASVARWAEMFNRVEQERDAALARVAELEKQEPVAYVLFRDGEVYYETDDNIVISNTPGDETDLYRWLPVFTAPVAQAQQLHDLDKQCRDDVARALGLLPSQERGFAWSYLLASIKSCVKASEDTAQAQHSVPEASEQEKEQGWTLDYRFVERVTDLAASRTEYTTSMEATEQVLLAARELLAAEAQALREEVAKLRARVVPREVLERSIDRWACCAMSQTPGAEEAWEELRALLSEQEGGKQ